MGDKQDDTNSILEWIAVLLSMCAIIGFGIYIEVAESPSPAIVFSFVAVAIAAIARLLLDIVRSHYRRKVERLRREMTND